MELVALTSENIDEVVEVYREAHASSFWKDYTFDSEILKQSLLDRIGKKDSFAWFCKSDGKIVGGFFGSLGRFPFCSDLFGMEEGIYVSPEHRGSRAALLLFTAFFNWCHSHDALPFLEIYYGEDNEKTYNFCKKMGLRECGKKFIGEKNGLRK